ncbi:MAG: GNAT family N-acetyltransferase, partial [Reyranella sp.]|nr:GNAT family N-acetyltransferase [Reyranella sp.]
GWWLSGGVGGPGGAAWPERRGRSGSLLGDTHARRGPPPWTGERCRAVLRDHPVARPGWIVVARRGGEAIGLAVGHVLGDGVYAYFTGVRRGWRGRGIGLALKLALIDAARAQGVATMRATNLDRNGPIRRVNDALGFRRLLGTIEYRKPLSPAGRRPAR